MSTIRRWYPVTSDYGLLQAPLGDVVQQFVEWQTSFGAVQKREIRTDLESAFEALAPLSAGMRRRIFVATNSQWTACFQSGIDGSDPTPATSFLAKRMGVLGMRVCCTPDGAPWPGTIWEVYAPESLGGVPPLSYRRSICAANDGGRWVFEQSGDAYEFEDLRAYERPKKRDRFTRELLEEYLKHFGIRPFADDFFLVNDRSPAVLLERPPWQREPPSFTLDEVIARVPWKRTE